MARSDYRFCFPFRVRYAEIDAQGVVFNAHYLTYFDTAVSEYLRALNFDYEAQIRSSGEDFHTVKTLVEYKAPINFDDEIDVHVRAARIGRTSLSFLLEIHARDQDALRASGEIVWVNTDQTSHLPAPHGSAFVDLLKAFEGDGLERS